MGLNESFIKDLIGKQVKVFLKNKFYYQCVILDCNDNMLKVKDRFKGVMFFGFSEIQKIVPIDVEVNNDDRATGK